MESKVYIKDLELYEYDNKKKFAVNKIYSELNSINLNLCSDKKIYDGVRDLLIDMGFDKKNVGTKKWNPFSDFIKPGDQVLIKPNLVLHINKNENGTIDSLITNFSVIRPIIDYTILALNGKGKIIVGDAPVQDCNFEELLKINKLKENIESYKSVFNNISLIDFRKNTNDKIDFVSVNMTEFSSFKEIDSDSAKYAITNYSLEQMKEHHNATCHEYLIPKIVLDSDIIINLPKPKTHRKAGMTACCKNFIGINGSKEWLPHHRSGSILKNGDEYPENSLLKKLNSKIEMYIGSKNSTNIFMRLCRKLTNLGLKLTHQEVYKEGSWFGNDTIWRTILDINKLIIYADKDGKIKKNKQRTIFNFADMIISGEKEGPLLPTDKPVGYVVAGFNQLEMDYVISKIMGFDFRKIKYINEGFKLKEKSISLVKYSDIKVIFNGKVIKSYENINKKFIPSAGWDKNI
ncbi:MAG: DUF362 domain-containing protein [Clostridia bacterium]